METTTTSEPRWPTPPKLRLEYDLTAVDASRVTVWMMQNRPEWIAWRKKSRSQLLSYLTCAILISIVALWQVSTHWHRIVDRGEAHHLLWVLGAVYCWWCVSVLRKSLRQHNAQTRSESDHAIDPEFTSGVVGHYAMELHDSGFWFHRPERTAFERWSGIRSIEATPDLVLVINSSRLHWPIPKRAFTDRAAADSFVAECRSLLAASGAGDSNAVREFLAEREFPCPKCKYNLRGAAGTCPECGISLDAASIPQAFR